MSGMQLVIRRGWLPALALLALPLWAGAEAGNHSGTVQTLNKDAGTIVLGEIGPWRVKEGVTEVTERTIIVTKATEFSQARRAAGAGPGGWIGEFVEVKLTPWEVRKGDFVTVEVSQEGERLTALKVTVVAPEGR
jgi:hypothetical protein